MLVVVILLILIIVIAGILIFGGMSARKEERKAEKLKKEKQKQAKKEINNKKVETKKSNSEYVDLFKMGEDTPDEELSTENETIVDNTNDLDISLEDDSSKKIEEKRLNNGELKLPDDEEERRQYHYTKNFLELNGYKHYEISNFAKPGCESKHNMNCWEQKQYVGFGVAAHSYVNGVRYANTSNLKEYLNVNYNEKGFKTIKTIEETQNKLDMEKEFMMLGLRKLDGVSISKFEQKFGENPIYLFRNELQKLVEEDLLEVDLDDIKLTKKGLDLANLVWEEFI